MMQDIKQLDNRFALNDLNQHIAVESSMQNNREAMLALSKIQLGDILSGKLILEQGQTLLKLESGLKLLAHLPHAIQSDQLLNFLVVGKNRQQLELQQVTANQAEHAQDAFAETIVRDMQLPNTVEMKNIISQWMDQQLPLIKHQLMQVYHLTKQYGVPSETIIQLNARAEMPSEKDIKQMLQFKEQGIHQIKQFMQLFLEETDQAAITQFAVRLGQQFRTPMLNQLIQRFQQQWETEMSNVNEINGQRSDSLSDTTQFTGEGMSGSVQRQGQEGVLLNTITGQNKLMSTPEVVFETFIQTLSEPQLKKFVMELAQKYLVLSQDDLKENPKEEIHKLQESTKRLKVLIDEMRPYMKSEIMEESTQTVDQMVQLLDKWQMQGQYVCVPFMLQEQSTSGELYFFKPKKRKEKGNTCVGMYIVLALDMPHLHHLEIHLKEQQSTLHLTLKAANNEIVKYMKAHQADLKEHMKDLIFPIGSIEMVCLDQPISQKLTSQPESMSRLDFRI